MNKINNACIIENYKINKNNYFDYINNNEKFTDCQKKTLINYFKLKNSFFVRLNSNIQISSYYLNALNNKNIEEINRLHELLYKFSTFELSYNIINLLRKKQNLIKDSDIINIISKNKNYQKIIDKYKMCNKWVYALEYIVKKIITINDNIKIDKIKYLDIGCGDANKTIIFSKKLNLKKKNIYCADVQSWGPYQKNKKLLPLEFRYIIDNKLNFNNNFFDIVSVILTLHHVKNLENFIKEIYRIIKKNGYLLLIEHSVYTDYDKIFINIEHLLYSALYDKRANYITNPDYINCFNIHEWNFIMSKNNFEMKICEVVPFGNEFENKYDNIFYALYAKK
jgi:ubiquinone/menaquinone biosynthesis C-methylase UbiE